MKKHFFSSPKAAILFLIIVILIAQMPFHYTESQFKNTIYKNIQSQEHNIPFEQVKIKKEKDQGLLKIYTFTYMEDGDPRRGQAIFVKNLVLPLYRLHDVFKGGDQDFKYITAVKDIKEINVVEINGADIKIIETEQVFIKNVLWYLFIFVLFQVVVILKRKYYKEKDKANKELKPEI